MQGSESTASLCSSPICYYDNLANVRHWMWELEEIKPIDPSCNGSMIKHDRRSVCFPPISHLQSVAWWLQTTWRDMLPTFICAIWSEDYRELNQTIHWKKRSKVQFPLISHLEWPISGDGFWHNAVPEEIELWITLFSFHILPRLNCFIMSCWQAVNST